MEATGTPPAAATTATAGRQRGSGRSGEPKASGGWRALAVMLFSPSPLPAR